ncbi:olfactory receptor 13C4-like [Anomaloglossus baeobatrachus]
MEQINQTSVKSFILLGLSGIPHLQAIYFLLFLIIYTITLTGNVLLIVVVRVNSQLHTPMYFFLSNLSFIDICFSSTIVPKLLINTLSQDKSISFLGCASQMYFSLALGATECITLAVMAYDRYVAICNPLRYQIIMNTKLPYCKSHHVNHFFFSYFHIITTILKINSTKGRYKAFSTCASHLTVVSLYYGTIMFMCLRPRHSYYPDQDRAIAILYTVVTPMLNPIIYSIRNKDVTETLRKKFSRKENY